MLRNLTLAVAAMISVASTSALSEQRAKGGERDPRIRTFIYYDDDVYRINAATGYISTVMFAPGETVVDVEAGDTLLWQINTLTAGDRFSFKPVKRTPQPTNMTVHTDRRVYTFLIYGLNGNPSKVGFRYKFEYPEDEDLMAARPPSNIIGAYLETGKDANLSYTASGDQFLRPEQTFDDGQKTYIRLPANSVRPAVFAMEADGRERLVNTTDLPDGTIVVSGVFRQLVLRDGPYQTSLFNKPLYKRTQGRIEKPRYHNTITNTGGRYDR